MKLNKESFSSFFQIRVDFVDTEFISPNDGMCRDQFMVVGGSIWPVGIDKVCGLNPDQHFYVHLDREVERINVDFTVTTIVR